LDGVIKNFIVIIFGPNLEIEIKGQFGKYRTKMQNLKNYKNEEN